MKALRSHRLHAARVATAATAVVMACYVVCVVALSLFVAHRLDGQADARLASRLAGARHAHLGENGGGAALPGGSKADPDDEPVFLWRVAPSGAVRRLTVGEPSLPSRRWETAPETVALGSVPFRVEAVRTGSSWLVAGESVAEIPRLRGVLALPELLFGLLLAAATFGGALVVGLRASAPLDLIRRRQAEFTADASHELRTPLSVVEAEVDLALRRRRAPEEYEDVLRRIAGESRRLTRIVEDLLWLSRADSGVVEHRASQRADVREIATSCVDRLRALAERRRVSLTFEADATEGCVVHATPELVERLAAVLIDNACKYAGEGGTAEVCVHSTGGRVTLRVDDSGPGIPVGERSAIFDRFRRATTEPGGTGLGLAIADSVVRITGGTWSVGDAPLGGARMEVSWRRVSERTAHRAGLSRTPVGPVNDDVSGRGDDPTPPSPGSPGVTDQRTRLRT